MWRWTGNDMKAEHTCIGLSTGSATHIGPPLEATAKQAEPTV